MADWREEVQSTSTKSRLNRKLRTVWYREPVRRLSEVSLEMCRCIILQARTEERFRRILIQMIRSPAGNKREGKKCRAELKKTFKWQGRNGALKETEKKAEMHEEDQDNKSFENQGKGKYQEGRVWGHLTRGSWAVT